MAGTIETILKRGGTHTPGRVRFYQLTPAPLHHPGVFRRILLRRWRPCCRDAPPHPLTILIAMLPVS